ncbi:MAG: ribonuclease E/G [Alphaproteobacteria bacterium]|nr:ribonuclease E/G [Alphaproteobacteria bacterium]
MSKQMLIDATHSEETRVVVLEDGRLDEFDVDTSTKKQIKGNIYLAKVIRVEPSLQAAFVDYGGNKHGFLAFGEIHPDYYQIPVADREALKKQMMEEAAAEKAARENEEETESDTEVEAVSDSDVDDVIRHRSSFFRKYKIQEVIRQGQVMLVQVIKEERGNKGAALTTYLSLAGRFSVLMPNNSRGGGVSRKISSSKDRKTLREIVDKLPIPEGMSVIIRTAGQGKTKSEIKRDFDYLMKTWMQIRKITLESIAPKLIHEEGDIIKRSLRDVFTPDIDEVLVGGEDTFKTVRTFMKTLMPTQVKKVKQYKGDLPLFQQYQVEDQLELMHSNIVQLRSGGYLVIDQTEALVAVDVNSGRATREHNIEETALRTNLETCDELARQLRLRDLAGLIVIDFIDMDEPRNNAAVERRLKEALKRDRARVQVGKMSGFGLMEMSRQRLHSSFLESSYHVCPHCGGKGLVRSTESSAMHALHLLDEAAAKNQNTTLVMTVPPEIASYVLNMKRETLRDIETRFGVQVQVMADAGLVKASDYRMERIRANGDKATVHLDAPVARRVDKNSERAESIDAIVQAAAAEEAENGGEGHHRRHGRNRRRDWRRKQKQLAENQATINEQHAADEKAPENAEPNFTIVEQASLNEVTDEHKKGKYRNHKRRSDKKDDQNLPAVHEDKVPAERTEHVPAPVIEEAKKSKKGGWWNRLIGE